MKFLKYIFIVFSILILVWMDLPENIPVNMNFFGKKINFKINPLTINLQALGINYSKKFSTKLGLDLRGGSHLVFEADISKLKNEDVSDAINSVRDIIEKRVNLFGVSEPVIQTVKAGKSYRINVDLPGIENTSEAIALIGQTAQLIFREEATDSAKVATDTPAYMLLTKDTGLHGNDVKKSRVDFSSQTGQPQVTLEFSRNGAKKFSEITKRNLSKPVGIFIDQFLISAPVVQQQIDQGTAVITGNFTLDEAKQLVIAINSGALPLPVKLIEQRNVGPTLGAEEVRKSVVAGAIGLGMVLLFMIGYYGRLGIIASMALGIYGLISLAIFRGIPIVLTLPGIAGFILSIGMAVDSNILIFERIKEEIRKGKDFDVSIRLGFGRAIDAIKDANITTLLVAFILFNPLNWDFLPQFGLIRGFALTLGIGVATSLFTGVVITKRLINTFYKIKN